MIRQSAVAALLVLGAAVAPPAGAADPDLTFRTQEGKVRCLVSADYQDRGYPAAICGVIDGPAFSAAPMSTGIANPVRLNLAVVVDNGQFFWEYGSVPGSAADDVVLNAGQTIRGAGWTITNEGLRTVIKNDLTGHGMNVTNAIDVRQT